ncbi:response regulator [Dapis sp. BLCC M229]|uniref:response regulator n=1 Tax=Dapis sp. BLCC M229 TaxID=3400188 RepID=UPI003CF6A95C
MNGWFGSNNENLSAILPAEIPYIIAVTANAMESDRKLCFDVGMNDYLSKPIRIQELIEVLRKYQGPMKDM